MHSALLSSFLVDLFQSHGCVVEDVSITNDSAGCMLQNCCLSTGKDSACDTEEQNGHHLQIPPPPRNFDVLALASVVVEAKKGVSRWESVTSGGIAARAKNTERKRSSVTVVSGPRGPRNAGIPTRKTSSDSRTRRSSPSLPERKVSMENFSVYIARKSPEQNTCTFDNLNEAKNASAIACAILFDQNSDSF